MAKSTFRIKDWSGGIREDVAQEDLPANCCTECIGFEINDKTGALMRQLDWVDHWTLPSLNPGSGRNQISNETIKFGFSHVYDEPDNSGEPIESIILVTDGDGYSSSVSRIFMRPWWKYNDSGGVGAYVGAWQSDSWKAFSDEGAYTPFSRFLFQVYNSLGEAISVGTGNAAIQGDPSDWMVYNNTARIAMGSPPSSLRRHWPIWLGYIKRQFCYNANYTVGGDLPEYLFGTYTDCPASWGNFWIAPAQLVAPQFTWHTAWWNTTPDPDEYTYTRLYGLYLQTPDDGCTGTNDTDIEAVTDGYGYLPAGTYEFAASYVYDGYQEGPLGINIGYGNAICDYRRPQGLSGYVLHLRLFIANFNSAAYGLNNSVYFGSDIHKNGFMDYRWTAIRVYMKFTPFSDETVAPIDWTLIAHIPLDKSFEPTGHAKFGDGSTGVGHWELNGVGTGGFGNWVGTDQQWSSAAVGHYGGFAYTNPTHANVGAYTDIYVGNLEALTGMTYWDSAGHSNPHMVWPHYERIGAAAGHVFIGNIKDTEVGDRFPLHGIHDDVFTDLKPDHSIRYAVRQGWNGLIAPDVFPPLNFISSETQSGEGPVQAIEELSGDAIILRQHSLTILKPSQTTGFVRLSDRFAGVGCIAPFSVVKVGDTLYFADEEGIWRYNGLRAELISVGVRDWWNGLTAAKKAATFAVYFPQQRQYWITDNSGTALTRILNIPNSSWIGHYSLSNPLGYIPGADESVYYFSGTKLRKRATEDSPTYVTPANIAYTSPKFDLDLPEVKKRFKDFSIAHQGQGVRFRVYIDNTIAGTLELDDHTAASQKPTVQKIHLYSTLGKQFYYKIDGNSGDTNTSTDCQVKEIAIDYEPRKK